MFASEYAYTEISNNSFYTKIDRPSGGSNIGHINFTGT